MRALTAIFLLILLASAARAESTVSSGETLYRQGLLPTGEPIHGTREAGVNLDGAAAACASCHRRSGLGTQEGQYIIPPIIGKYLFRPGLKNIEDMSLPHVAGYRPNRSAYDDVTLARAIREGIDADGRALNYLMPRFKLDDKAMASLISYLKDLTSQPVPGVTDDTLHFATIITPDADPVERLGMLDVMQKFFDDKNSFIRGGNRPMHAAREIMYRVTRRWQLHVWELSGPPDTWEKQLHERLAAEPVFAVISGLGGKTWAPVHHFCEQEAIPCLLPNINLPVVAEKDFYPVYFSRGVLLEAQLIAKKIQEQAMQGSGLDRSGRIIQIYRAGDIGEAAASALRTAMATTTLSTLNIALKGENMPQELASVLRGKSINDVIILWLKPEELAALPPAAPASQTVYISGLMGGLENAPIPPSWRSITRVSYPFDLPEQRKIRMNFPTNWFKVRNIPVVAERVQADTYMACGILAETLSEMLDSFVRDYLVERVEVMLSHRVITGYYPRLGLAPGQRFASKGGYMVQFASQDGNKLVADSGWIVP